MTDKSAKYYISLEFELLLVGDYYFWLEIVVQKLLCYCNVILLSGCIMFVLAVSNSSKADFNNVRIAHFDSKQSLNNSDEFRSRDADSGLSTSNSSANENIRGFAPLSESSGTFQLNDLVVICFTPSRDMAVRIVDTTPKGQTQKIFPRTKASAFATAGKEYCLGGPKSESTLRMGEQSGQGFGVLHMLGAPTENDLPPMDTAELPRIDITPNGTSSNGEIYEAWLRYTVE